MMVSKYPGIDVSYAMSRDACLINWKLFFEQKHIRDLEWLAAKNLSRRWQTTAVADVSVYLPRYKYNDNQANGTPRDYSLRYLSKKFVESIELKDLKKAKIVYTEIQKRGLKVVAEFLKL